jgi:spermidine/putrescine transport system substrate-binding protein
MSERDIVERHERDLVGLCRAAARGQITRRQFIERALLLGLSAGAVGALAGACGDEGATETAATPQLPAMDETRPEEITLYNWVDYMDPDIRKDFEKAEGIKVNESHFASNEELLSKLRAGASGYDVMVPSDYMLSIMVKSGLVQPLDMDYLPNFQYAMESLKAPEFDDPAENGGLKYSVPYFYGTTGYCVRNDKVSYAPTTWEPLFDEANKGKINMLDDERETLGALLKSLGYSCNTLDQAELDEATEKGIAQKPLVATYDSVNMKRAIVQGVPFVMCWDGDVLMGIDSLGGDDEAKALLRYILPEEGFVRWTDAMSIPSTAEERYGAHLFMDYLMNPEVAGKNASWVWYLSAFPASHEFTDPFALTLAPDEETLARGEQTDDVGEFTLSYQQAWQRIKSA